MKTYLFFTTEGYTEAPNGVKVENIQLLGRAKGNVLSDVLDEFLIENPWILENGFKKENIYAEQIVCDI